MPTYTQVLYHIVFSTKNRARVLLPNERDKLFRYVWGIVNAKNCHLYRINGTEDHIHVLTSLHPTQALSSFVRDVKIASSKWIKDNNVFGAFPGWQDGYGAFTHSIQEKDALIEYIKSQELHHKKMSFREELEKLLNEAGIEFDGNYLL